MVTGQPRLGVLLLSGLLACAGAAGIWGQTRHHPVGPTCLLHYQAGTIDRQSPPLSEAQRKQLLADQARLVSSHKDLSRNVDDIKYQIALLRIDQMLTPCEYARAMLRQDIGVREAALANAVAREAELAGAGTNPPQKYDVP